MGEPKDDCSHAEFISINPHNDPLVAGPNNAFFDDGGEFA